MEASRLLILPVRLPYQAAESDLDTEIRQLPRGEALRLLRATVEAADCESWAGLIPSSTPASTPASAHASAPMSAYRS